MKKILFFILASFLFLASSNLYAIEIRPNTTVDTISSNTCSLRQAVIAINEQRAVGACPAGDGNNDTILLNTSDAYVLSRVDSRSDTSDLIGSLKIRRNMSITSSDPSSNAKATVQTATHFGNVMISASSDLTLSKLILQGNVGQGYIHMRNAQLAITDSILRIQVFVTAGSLFLRDTWITEGISTSMRLHLHNIINALIENTTISGNYDKSATIDASCQTSSLNNILIRQSTITHNDNYGGGNTGTISLSNCNAILEHVTIANNQAVSSEGFIVASGILNENSRITLKSSIVYDTQNNVAACAGNPLIAEGVNILNDCPATPANSQSRIIQEDPRLLPLGNNGGPTPTMALNYGSPAIDTSGETSGQDQRHGQCYGNCDLGAYEKNSPTFPPEPPNPNPPPPGGGPPSPGSGGAPVTNPPPGNPPTGTNTPGGNNTTGGLDAGAPAPTGSGANPEATGSNSAPDPSANNTRNDSPKCSLNPSLSNSAQSMMNLFWMMGGMIVLLGQIFIIRKRDSRI